jgi:glycosyltransferase involved in cell wall biosynthesis
MDYGKVSVIIPTYNRFKYLLNTVNSVKEQTYKNIEIIVINDCSDQEEYYSYDWKDVIIINLKENSKKTIGFPCAAYVRNQGINVSSGKYIAFCDDDDIWFPNKLELQLKAMKETGCKMSCTDGLIGVGVFDKNKVYKKYNAEYYYDILQNIYIQKGSNLLENGFSYIWDLNFLKIHNCVICSSVVIEKEILNTINNMEILKNCEDYQCWLKSLEHTNLVYIKDVCFYYDSGHGDGQNYQ